MAWGGSKTWAKTDTVAQPDTELNRIEVNTESVITDMTHVDWPTLTHKSDRVETDEISLAEIQNIEGNCQTLSNMLGVSFVDKSFIAGSSLMYTDFNRWEVLLAYLHAIAQLIPDQLVYCGTFNCGEDGDIY